MTYEEAKAACFNVDELYGEDDIHPILPFVQLSISSNSRRTYVVVWDTRRNEWYDLYAYQGDTVERVKIAWQESQSHYRNKFAVLVSDARHSDQWQVLSLEKLILLNRRDWRDIPHCRG